MALHASRSAAIMAGVLLSAGYWDGAVGEAPAGPFAADPSLLRDPAAHLYVLAMTHVEGDFGEPEGDPGCPAALYYQTLPLPPLGQPAPGPAFAIDIRGTELLREILQNYHDSYGSEPRLFIEPAGEFWQTEAGVTYGRRLFQTYDYAALGYEFGIQGHAIQYSGANFCWYNSAHTAEGVQRKLSDLHLAAQGVLHNGQPVNHGQTFTGGWKPEQQALGAAAAEYLLDHAAHGLGYRISFEDHDGHIEDEPAGINNARPSYYVYRADYGDGVQMTKIDFNGSVTVACAGGTPRCETPAEAIARFDTTVAAKNADGDPSHIYFFAFTIHSDGVWADVNRAAIGQPMIGEGAGLLALMDAIEQRKNAGVQIEFVTPSALAAIFAAANPPDTSYVTESVETWVTAPNGNQLYMRVVQPVPGLYPGQRFPALIAIPGGTGPGAPLADSPAYRNFAGGGFVVVVFNPEGRGNGAPGNLVSQGVEDCNGFVHQDDLKAVVEHTAGRSNVDPSNIGVETASFGIAIGAGALGRYPSLPVKYLVDQEGPHDNRVITFYDVGPERQVCGHWSTVTDPSPGNIAFWAEREAVRHIGGFRGLYLRMQAEIDHAQGPGYFRHTIEMNNAATHSAYGGAGSACWTRVNGADLGNPINTVYPPNDPNQYPDWVTGRLADHPGLNLTYDREMALLSCPASIPAVSAGGLVFMAGLMVASAAVLCRRRRILVPGLTVLFLAFASTTERARAAPIHVLIDLHADPMFGTPVIQQQVFQDWVDATNWALDTADTYSAKVSFLCGGDFAEWVLEDPARGYPLLQRLYASGGQIGTHSHDQVRFATHDWRSLPPNPTPPQALQLWNDHVGLVNAAITAALGISGGPQLALVNCGRGSHVPSDDAFRLQLMSDFGFTMHQQGPDEEFYSYFRHYPMNPYRPSGAGMLEHDPGGPVVLSPFGPVLGRNDVHFGISQDMRVPAWQARFLLEILNWLHDVHVAGTQRVWVTGWGSHSADMMVGTPTRAAFPVTLNWLAAHFIGQPVGGYIAAQFSGVPAARNAYLAWEAAHPGEASFTYAANATDWSQYPYLAPTARYLSEAWYEEAMPSSGTVRWHRLTASASAGGPYSLYVAYTTDGIATTVDLSASLGAGEIAAVVPASGAARRHATASVAVGTTGVILVPVDKLMSFAGTGDFEPDGDVDGADAVDFAQCFTGPGGALAPGCEPGDFDDDSDVDCADWDGLVLVWTAPEPPPAFDTCAAAIPALSVWGVVAMSLLLAVCGGCVIRAGSTRRDARPPVV